jgi:hypothetical protein
MDQGACGYPAKEMTIDESPASWHNLRGQRIGPARKYGSRRMGILDFVGVIALIGLVISLALLLRSALRGPRE